MEKPTDPTPKSEDIKQVIVVRKDLNMPPGKLAAQVSHASMAFLTDQLRHSDKDTFLAFFGNVAQVEMFVTDVALKWINGIFTKVVLAADSYEQLLALEYLAKQEGIEAHLITDAGLTVFDGPTVTCLGIGPDLSTRINKVTGGLKLYK